MPGLALPSTNWIAFRFLIIFLKINYTVNKDYDVSALLKAIAIEYLGLATGPAIGLETDPAEGLERGPALGLEIGFATGLTATAVASLSLLHRP